MLNKFFHLVYDIELISEDAFHEWKNSNDPNEQNGKGVATTATRAFFQWDFLLLFCVCLQISIFILARCEM